MNDPNMLAAIDAIVRLREQLALIAHALGMDDQIPGKPESLARPYIWQHAACTPDGWNTLGKAISKRLAAETAAKNAKLAKLGEALIIDVLANPLPNVDPEV